MKIAVLGTGMVGHAIASKLVSLGHEVMMGSRTADNVNATAWIKTAGAGGAVGTFADAARFAELVFNCTQGASSLAALHAAGAANLDGKVVVDVANVLSPQRPGSESLGETLQTAFPRARVVKTLNTINCGLMVDPCQLTEPHTLFISGNDAGAKATVRELLRAFGWTDILDLGDIATARATEGYLPLWSSLSRQLGTMAFNIKVVR